MREIKYKIAETFLSIQGEGAHAGKPMAFVRLSQCPVGGPKGICKSWNSTEFVCDTGRSYANPLNKVEHHPYTEVNSTLSAKDITDWVEINNFSTLCITGGEPLIYDLEPLWWSIVERRLHMHIETSGTTDIPKWMHNLTSRRLWICVSPKHNFKPEWITRANEFKILITHETTADEILNLIKPFTIFNSKVCLQPIDDNNFPLNSARAVELCKSLQIRLSLQVHKWIGLR